MTYKKKNPSKCFLPWVGFFNWTNAYFFHYHSILALLLARFLSLMINICFFSVSIKSIHNYYVYVSVTLFSLQMDKSPCCHSAQMRDVYEMVLCREGHPVPLFVSICTMQVHCRKTGQMEWKDNGKLALASQWRGTRCSPELRSDRVGT